MNIKNLYEEFPLRDVDKEYMSFYYTRLTFENSEELVRLYNRECEIGLTGERVQIIYIIMLHKIFIKRFNKSPMVISKDLKVELNGKIKLNNNDFVFIDRKMNIIRN